MTACTQTMGESSNYFKCRRPAKWMTPGKRSVCGIHRHAIDRFYQRNRDPRRCTPLTKERPR